MEDGKIYERVKAATKISLIGISNGLAMKASKLTMGKRKKKNQNEIKVNTVKLDFVPVQMVVQVRGGMDS